MDAPLYNAEILRLAASIPHARRLDAPQGTPLAAPYATSAKTSPICGSRVTADVSLSPDGRVAAFGQEVRACALGQAAAAILGAGVIGQTAPSLRLAHAGLVDWLKGDGVLPPLLAADFPRLALFEPARSHPARHGSILLAFDAAATAAEAATSMAPAG